MTRVLTHTALVLVLNIHQHPGQSRNIAHPAREASVARWTERSQNDVALAASHLPFISTAPCS